MDHTLLRGLGLDVKAVTFRLKEKNHNEKKTHSGSVDGYQFEVSRPHRSVYRDVNNTSFETPSVLSLLATGSTLVDAVLSLRVVLSK